MPRVTKKVDSVNLDDLDRKQLDDSGLTIETIEANRIETKNNALVFPYCDLEGKYNGFARTRPHKPRKNAKGKTVKYEQPKGTPPRAYFPAASLPIIKQPLSPIFITEGEKKALALAQLGIAAIGLGGVWCWKVKDEDGLIPDLAAIGWEGREVFVVFDHDTIPDTYANVQRAAQALADELKDVGARCVLNVEILDGCGKGIDDFLTLQKRDPREAFRELINHAELLASVETSKRRSVDSPKRIDVDEFPVDAFCPMLAEFITSIGKAIPCPVDYPGTMILPVLGALIGTKRKAAIKESWVQPPLLWTACNARSGDGKSAPFDAVTEPTRKLEVQLTAEYLDELTIYDAMTPEEREEKQAEKPTPKQILTTDTTIEALRDILKYNPNGIIAAIDELSGWVRSMSQYKGGKGNDRQLWTSIYDHKTMVVNRQQQKVVIPDPFVAVTGTIQPDVMGTLIDRRWGEDGFAARILISYPDPFPPSDFKDCVFSCTLDYKYLCETLFRMPSFDSPLTFTTKAYNRWVSWHDEHVREVFPSHLRPVWGKIKGASLRIALILYVSRLASESSKKLNSSSQKIDLDAVEGAIMLAEYFKSHSYKAYDCAIRSSDQGPIENAVRKIQLAGGQMTIRDIENARISGVRNRREAQKLADDLVGLGRGEIRAGKRRDSVIFKLFD